jgi:hypothetical protein
MEGHQRGIPQSILPTASRRAMVFHELAEEPL